MPTSMSRPQRLILLAALLVVLSIGACGDSGNDEASSDSASQSGETVNTTPPPSGGSEPKNGRRGAGTGPGAGDKAGGSPKGQVRGVVQGMYRDLASGDAAGVCSRMSDAARAQIAQNVPGGSTESPEDRSCVESMSAFLRAARGSGVLDSAVNATVTKVVVNGTTATAIVSFNGTSGNIALTRERGAWRFGTDALAPTS